MMTVHFHYHASAIPRKEGCVRNRHHCLSDSVLLPTSSSPYMGGAPTAAICPLYIVSFSFNCLIKLLFPGEPVLLPAYTFKHLESNNHTYPVRTPFSVSNPHCLFAIYLSYSHRP